MIEENVSSPFSPPRYIFLTFPPLQAKRSKEIPPFHKRGRGNYSVFPTKLKINL